jgi:arsenate reductase-like glutaredoxin family protein
VLVAGTRLLAMLLLACAGLASAQQYRWTDDQGRVHYGDTPPPASAKDVQRKKSGSAAPQARTQSARVTLYTAPNCTTPCRDARRVLDERGVVFTEVSVSDPASIAELKQAVGTDRIPALVIGTQALVGFSPATWSAALDAAGHPRLPASAVKPRALPTVSLYTNSNCGALCREAREYLQSRRVPFTEVAVEDPADVAKLRSLTGQQNVPVLTVGSVVQRGYDPGLYARALSDGGYPQAPN